ncbi:MAG: hypothetical protein KGK17_02430 [Betaproteobacteria bacterium]|nr:hypothetical protein [Betaproteobacteria bacterium]
MEKSKYLFLCFAAVTISFADLAVAADSGSITITSPKEGAVLQSGSGNKLEYNLHMSPNGSHLHIYVDDQDPIIGRKVSNCPCSIDLPALTPGKHVIVVKEATAGHSLTGVQSTVAVSVK